jgi:signal transduction histidine kinase
VRSQSLIILSNVSEHLSMAATSGEVIRNVPDMVAGEIANWCVLYLLNADHSGAVGPVSCAHDDDALTEDLYLYLKTTTLSDDWTGAFRRTLESGETEVSAPVIPISSHRFTSGQWICTPIILMGEIVGALVLVNAPFSVFGIFSDDDRLLAENLARKIGTALHNASMLERMHDANARAAEAVQSKDEFLSMVTHEIRSPLHTLTLWTYILRGIPTAQTRHIEAIDKIERGAANISALLENIADITRLTLGKFRLNRTAVEIVEIIDVVVATMTDVAEAKGVTLIKFAATDVGTVIGDHERLLQVVSNLVTNAIKFTPRGGRVIISVASNDQSVLVKVSDTGDGLSTEQVQNIFNRFGQGRYTKATMTLSHGLELAMSKQLIELHGGILWVESEEGNGTTFYAQLPLNRR